MLLYHLSFGFFHHRLLVLQHLCPLSLSNSAKHLKTRSTLSTTATAFTALALIPIYIFFLLYYRDFYLQFLFYILKGNEEEEVEEVVHQIQKVVQNYLIGLLMVIFIVAVANSIGLMVLGVKHAIFFGTLAGVLNIIPYIGVLIGSLLPILYSALTMESWFYPIMVAIIFWGIQTLEGNVITPYVVGSKVRINPLAAILALIIGGLIWGPAGMIIFIPFIAILKVVLDAVPSTRAYGFVLGLPPVEKQPTSPPRWIETLKETTGLSTPKNVQDKKDEE
ncbi:MAG: hypothetical protein BRD50_07485 [Bacteroidetes bacterium SW_11_45_7]|nr:MAG: hypothetical protein BRD50_07485 [Bacteroidetes bacterium SW_11_45_7]